MSTSSIPLPVSATLVHRGANRPLRWLRSTRTPTAASCLTNTNLFMTDSKVDRWGAGVVQEIDAAAMHVWFNWQHLELEVDFAGNGTVVSNPAATSKRQPGLR